MAWGMVAMLLVLVGGAAVALRLQRTDLLERVADLEGQLSIERIDHQTELDERDQLLALLLDPGAQCFDFQGTPDTPGSLRGKATYDAPNRRAVIALENATLPANQDYELWAIRDGTPVSLGVIERGSDGSASIYVADVGDPAGISDFAISLEPQGGSTQAGPSGPVVLITSMGG